MILERLEITGFGSLHDLSEDLHPRVTVIAGRNESGKSTLLRAVRGALYGVDAGGQGRAVDRSDWARYEPWTRGGYGLALTYKLDDGPPHPRRATPGHARAVGAGARAGWLRAHR